MSATYAPPAAPTSRRWVAAVLVAVPAVWCAALLAFMRPDAVVAREEVAFEIKWVVYDECDLTAMAMRGGNAHMGRLPGRRDEPEERWHEEFTEAMDSPPEPLAERYYLEYPTPTLALFRLGYLFQPRTADLLPPQVADGQQLGVAFFEPRDDAERAAWTRLHWAVVTLVLVMTAALAGLILVLRRGYEPSDPTPWTWLCVLPGAVFFSLNRFDVLPVFLTAVGFALMGRKRDGWSGAAFAAAALLKVYPVLLAPVILRHLGLRRGAAWLAAFAGTGLAVMGYSVLELGWESTVGPIKVQLSRKYIEKSWTLYETVLPAKLAGVSKTEVHEGMTEEEAKKADEDAKKADEDAKKARLAILAAVILAASATRPAGFPGLLRRCAVVLVTFVVLAVFWSPQWIVWFLPLLAPLAPRRRWVGVAAVLLDAANYFNFPVLFWILYGQPSIHIDVKEGMAEAMIWVRAALWFGLAAGLVYDEWWAKRAERLATATAPAATGS